MPSSNILIQMFRYGVSGGIAFVVDFTVMLFFHEIVAVNTSLAATLGFCAGLVITYVMSIGWIFDKRRIEKPLIEFFIFALIGGVGIVMTYYIMIKLQESLDYDYTILKLITTFIVTLFNFAAKKLLLFTK